MKILESALAIKMYPIENEIDLKTIPKRAQFNIGVISINLLENNNLIIDWPNVIKNKTTGVTNNKDVVTCWQTVVEIEIFEVKDLIKRG